MASSKFITVDTVISRAQIALGHTDDGYRNVFREFVWDAVLEIGVSTGEKKTELITIDGLNIEKPCDYLYPVDLTLKSQSDKFRDIFATYQALASESKQKRGSSGLSVSEDDENFILERDQGNYTQAELTYYSYPVDDKGMPKIVQHSSRAIVAYIEYMFAKRIRSRNFRMMPMSDIQFLNKQWEKLYKKAKTHKDMPNGLQIEELMSRWASLIPDMGMYSRNFRTFTRGYFYFNYF